MGGMLEKIYEYNLPRKWVYATGITIGIFSGVINSFLDLDFTFRPALLIWLLTAIITVIILHEAIHGMVAKLFGHNPIFGLKLPLVYITFSDKIPRGHFILVALAPLVILDIVFILMYINGVLKLFSDFCIVVNTIGATGDVWIVIKLLGVEKGTLVQDKKTGFEVWKVVNSS